MLPFSIPAELHLAAEKSAPVAPDRVVRLEDYPVIVDEGILRRAFTDKGLEPRNLGSWIGNEILVSKSDKPAFWKTTSDALCE
jgi:hypothetical protein